MKKLDFNGNWTCRPLKGDLEACPVRLPHDAMRTERRAPDSLGEGNIGFFEGGDYEYRKVFTMPERQKESTWSWNSRACITTRQSR